jgi:DNA-binding beta-propeller fold protein YncE
MRKYFFRSMTLLAVLLVQGGCSEPPKQSSVATELETAQVWPEPPAPARIRYVRSVVSPSDWGIKQNFLGQAFDMLTGKTPVHFVRPTGVVERDGVLYVADPGAPGLFLYDAKQERASQFGSVGDEALVSPVALALGPADTLFLVDSWQKNVYVLNRNGELRRLFAHEGLQRPSAVAFDAAGERVYVADSMAHHVLAYGLDGRLLQTIGSNGTADGEFNSPTHLAVERDGTLLVTDALNFRVQAFDRSGHFLWKIGKAGDGGGDFAAPKGVAADSEGQVLVVDALFDALQIFKPDGSLLLGFGGEGRRAGQFWLPNGLFIDPLDAVYVADSYNRRIQIFQRIAAPNQEAAK